MAALIIFLISLGFVVTPQDQFYTGYRHFHNTGEVSTVYGTRFLHDAGEPIYGIEYSHNRTNLDFDLQYKGGVYRTEAGSTFLSVGLKKDILLGKDFALTAHLMPTLSFVVGDDKQHSSSYLNFNARIEASYTVVRGVSIGVGVMHISNADIQKPNDGMNFATIGIKVSF